MWQRSWSQPSLARSSLPKFCWNMGQTCTSNQAYVFAQVNKMCSLILLQKHRMTDQYWLQLTYVIDICFDCTYWVRMPQRNVTPCALPQFACGSHLACSLVPPRSSRHAFMDMWISWSCCLNMAAKLTIEIRSYGHMVKTKRDSDRRYWAMLVAISMNSFWSDLLSPWRS